MPKPRNVVFLLNEVPSLQVALDSARKARGQRTPPWKNANHASG